MSAYSPWIYRKILYKIPFLFKKCPGANYHWFWHKLCYCMYRTHTKYWNGGVYNFSTGNEIVIPNGKDVYHD